LFPLFANRLLSQSRPEYEAYLRWSGFEPGATPDPIVVLGVTEGIRQTDAVEVFPCPTQDADGCYLNKFFLHGIRWMAPVTILRINELREGERLTLVPDPDNEHDPQAVEVWTAELPIQIGYVPRYLAAEVNNLAQVCCPGFTGLYVHRVNRDAPLQNRVLCRMHACWPDGFGAVLGRRLRAQSRWHAGAVFLDGRALGGVQSGSDDLSNHSITSRPKRGLAIASHGGQARSVMHPSHLSAKKAGSATATTMGAYCDREGNPNIVRVSSWMAVNRTASLPSPHGKRVVSRSKTQRLPGRNRRLDRRRRSDL
jgi:hypothetical protein